MRHHFVPAFYQRNWANQNGKLVVYAMPIPGKVVASDLGPKGAGWREDLYAIGNGDPELRHFLETKFLQEADSHATVAMHRLLDSGPVGLDNVLRSAWTRFVLNTMVRHPEAFEEVRLAVDRRWNAPDDETQRSYERLKSPDMPANFSDYLRMQGDDLDAKIRINLIKGLLDNELIGDRLFNMQWAILDLRKSDFELMTSDQPLLKSVRDERRMIFLMPISPRAAFMATTHQEDARTVRNRQPSNLAKMLNKYVVRRARRFVFASNRHQSQFVGRHMSAEMQEGNFFPNLARMDTAEI